MPRYTRNKDIDEAVKNREFESLANYVKDEALEQDVRQHLADIILGLLTGKLKRQKGRPRKRMPWQTYMIAEEVYRAKKSNGWTKIESAIKYVAGKNGLSERTVWNYWRGFSAGAYEAKMDQHQLDAMMDAANEAMAEAALEWLKENEGDREFTDQEISDAAHELAEDWRDHDDY